MEAGDLDRRVTIQRSESARNKFNEPIESWSDLTTVWARRRDVSDGEKTAAAQVGATLMSRFVVRSSSITRTVIPTDRLNHDGGLWNILGVKELGEGRNRFLEITAVREAD